MTALDQDRRRGALPAKPLTPVPEPKVHAVITMKRGECGADLLTDDTEQGLGPRLDDRHVGTVLPRGGRGLAADPAGSHDHYVGTISKPLRSARGLFERPQRE